MRQIIVLTLCLLYLLTLTTVEAYNRIDTRRITAFEALFNRIESNNNELKNKVIEMEVGSYEHKDPIPTIEELDYQDEEGFLRLNKTNSPSYSNEEYSERMMRLAKENWDHVKSHGQCGTPIQRCLQVPSDDLRYWPNCALVHRCGMDSGCCKTPGQSCMAADTETVELYFYFYMNHGNNQRMGVNKLEYINDTKCECQYPMPVNTPRPETKQRSSKECRCPKLFTPKRGEVKCLCDCEGSLSHKCKKFKRGRRYFGEQDRQCIRVGECGVPSCDYGQYIKDLNRCPKKKESKQYIIARRGKLINA